MAKDTPLEQFQGTDHEFVFTILNAAETAAIDISGWALSWMMKRRKSDADASALLTKTTLSGIVISGTFNSVPATNTQVAALTIEDANTIAMNVGLYPYELKRTDPGFETVLSLGNFHLKGTVHR